MKGAVMEAQRSTDPRQRAGGRRRSRRAPLAVAALLALLVLCGLCAAAAPAPAGASVFTPLAATVAAPTITFTAPTGGESYATGSLLLVSWTTSPAAPAGGEFRLIVQWSTSSASFAETFVPATGASSYSTWLSLDVSSDGSAYKVVVAWRPTAGSGDWMSAASTPDFSVYGILIPGITVDPFGDMTHLLQGSLLKVWWWVWPTSITPFPPLGECGLWVRSASGWLYSGKIVPADSWHMSTAFETTLPLDVPLGDGYQVVVGWRPTAGSGFWGCWATSASFSVTAATADLTGLALSGSPASYSFAPATYAYPGVTVLNAVSRITVTPTGAGVITVNGEVVASGSESAAIALTAGTAKTITVVATEAGKSAKTYTILVTRSNGAQATPTFSPAAGAVAAPTNVTITSPGAYRIYYTTDGNTPNSSSPVYASPVAVYPPMTLKALAVRAGYDDSAIGSAAYTQAASADLTDLVLGGLVFGFNFAPATYTYTGVTVPYAMSSTTVTPTGAGEIRVNGEVVASGMESAAIPLVAGVAKTITVTATEPGKSAKTYAITVTRSAAPQQATPTFSPAAGAVAAGTLVTITSAGADRIYYTTDGNMPVVGSSPVYSAPVAVSPPMTLKALAVKAGYADSAVGSAAYTPAPATANLTGLALSGSPANYTFAPATYVYSGVTVLNAVSSITVTPSGAGVIRVNGTVVASGSASAAIALTAGTAKTITVTAAEAGKTAKTYAIEVTRSPAPVITVTAPAGSTTHYQGSSLTVSWTTSPAPTAGEFGVWARSAAGDLYIERLLAAGGGTSFYTFLVLDVPLGSGYQAIVAWRPTAGSGDWVSFGTSPGSFTVTRRPPPPQGP